MCEKISYNILSLQTLKKKTNKLRKVFNVNVNNGIQVRTWESTLSEDDKGSLRESLSLGSITPSSALASAIMNAVPQTMTTGTGNGKILSLWVYSAATVFIASLTDCRTSNVSNREWVREAALLSPLSLLVLGKLFGLVLLICFEASTSRRFFKSGALRALD